MDELEQLAEIVAENERRRQAILAWCEGFRADPHPECVLPYFAACIEAQAYFDDTIVDLADTGRMLLSANDTE